MEPSGPPVMRLSARSSLPAGHGAIGPAGQANMQRVQAVLSCESAPAVGRTPCGL